MFCPECGEVMCLGPLDARRAVHRVHRSVANTAWQWLRSVLVSRGLDRATDERVRPNR